MAKKLKIKKGQSKYMPHLRVTKSIGATKQYLGRGGGIGHIATECDGYKQTMVNEHGIHRTAEEMATKGMYGGLCNRSCCLSREAYWYNRGSYAYYCENCARLINAEFRHRDDVENYGSLLVKPPADLILEVHHGRDWVLMYSDGSEKRFDNEEAAVAAQRHYRYVTGLRSDGSDPLWFKDLSEKYEYLRTLVTVKADR